MDDADQARSLAKIYHHRLGAPTATTDSALSEWFTPAPTGDGPNQDVRAWLRTQSALIETRVTSLTDDVAAVTPVWAKQLPKQPQDAAQRTVWRKRVGAIVAYRDLVGVTDQDSALGVAPTYPEEPYTTAAAALTALRNQNDEQRQRAQERDEMVRRLAQRKRETQSTHAQPVPTADERAERLRRVLEQSQRANRSPSGQTTATSRSHAARACSCTESSRW
jgi:hypothetical protein